MKEKGLLQNAFRSHFWDSRSTSANVKRREVLLGYVVGPFGVMLLQSIVSSYFNQYLTDVMGFTAAEGAWIAGFMVMFPIISKLIDATTNVIMAKILDRTTCRQGKLRPWFILSLPIIVLSVIMLFRIPEVNPRLQAVWVIVSYNLFYSVGYTMWYMAYEMSAALSTRNVKQRSGNSMAGQITKNIGTGIVSILFPTILTGVCNALGQNMKAGYLATMAAMCCLAVPLTFVQYFFTRERVTEERRNQFEEGQEAAVTREASFGTQLQACLHDKYWIMLIVMILLYQVFNAMKTVSQVYYAGWVVHGNHYGEYAAIQARFSMISMAPVGPMLLVIVPLIRKAGRRRMIIIGSAVSVFGAGLAFFNAGSTLPVYVGTGLSAVGAMSYVYSMMTFVGDAIDHVEYSQRVRADGMTAALVGFVHSLSNGVGQGLFNLGLMGTGYLTPEKIGTDARGVALYADQSARAINWINFSYQGIIALTGVLFLVLFLFFFDIEKLMPTVSAQLQERNRSVQYLELSMSRLRNSSAARLRNRKTKQKRTASKN